MQRKSNTLAIVPPEPPPGPRATLADAIAAHREAMAAVAKVRSAVRNTENMVLEAESRHVRAKAALDEARLAQAARIVDAARSGEHPAASGTSRELRVAEAEAADDFEAAREALQTVRVPLEDLEAAERLAAEKVDDAAIAVLVAEVPVLLEDARRAYAVLVDKARVLNALSRWDVNAVWRDDRRPLVGAAERVAERVFSIHYELTGRGLEGQGDVIAPWSEALAALKQDANTPLPNP